MSISKNSEWIRNGFYRNIKTKDKAIIEKYTLKELNQAKYELARDSQEGYYIALLERIKELDEINNRKLTTKERWKDRAITFILGISGGLLIAYLKGSFKL